jgi:transcriptional regulator with XRE-family HTH domain
VDHGARFGNDQAVPKLSHREHEKPLRGLGEAIRRLRAERGLSQEKLALVAEVDRSYVGRIERGDNAVALPTLIKIAHALEITVAELMMIARL